MKKIFMLLWPIAFLIIFIQAGREVTRTMPNGPSAAEDIAMCSSPARSTKAGPEGKYVPALTGWGQFNYPISTTSDSAQFYFNQGLSFYYGYHFTEALASFKEASRFDPSSGMTYWGQALSMGPFYNTYVYKMKKEVPEVVAAMMKRSANATEKEKGLMEALSRRYSRDLTNADRKVLDRNYAMALSALMKKYIADDDLKALYIDAVMLEHKWDFWDHAGTPRPWTVDLVGDCESVLKRSKHPAIMHYYIHLTEASREPGRALQVADELKDQLPGIGHMVHMSTHMYQRNGLYAKGVVVNEQANASNNMVDAKAPVLGLGKDRSPHFFAVQSYCAMTAGMYDEGIPIYQRARDRQVALSNDLQTDVYAQFVYMIPAMANVRLGKWNAVLASPEVDGTWKYAVVLDNFAKGIAHLRGKDIMSATMCLQNIEAAMQDSVLSIRLMPFNSPLQSCRIASAILKAQIQFEAGKSDESLRSFQQAIEDEDHMVYREPQDWLIPARQYLGAYLLRMNKPREAEKIYLEDLVLNPGNGWSLLGMHQALSKQGRKKEAAVYETKYKKAFAVADVEITASVF